MNVTADLKVGLKGTAEILVGTRDTAPHVGSGKIKVLATPVMVSLMEEASLVAVEGLPFSSIERQVGVYYLKHQPLSRAGSRFLALCRARWDAPELAPSSVDLLRTPEK